VYVSVISIILAYLNAICLLVFCICVLTLQAEILSAAVSTQCMEFFITRATRSIARYILRRRGWLGGCLSQPVLCLND